jgi:anti-sigma factor RsiW
MNCADVEILICDYVDGTLGPAEKGEVLRHLAQCPACAELARDSAAAVRFMETAADIEPPPELVTRILFDAPWSKPKSSKARSWLRALLSPILQPKYAMGLAMTILSISVLAQWVAPVKQIKPSDLRPTAVWAGLEDRAVRTWARTVKFYENLKFVYQIQTTLREWQQQDREQRGGSDAKTDDHKLPVKAAPPQDGGGGSPPQQQDQH